MKNQMENNMEDDMKPLGLFTGIDLYVDGEHTWILGCVYEGSFHLRSATR